MDQLKIIKILKSDKTLCELTQKLQHLNRDKKNDMNDIIHSLNLPLNYHLFVLGNFSNLMTIKFN